MGNKSSYELAMRDLTSGVSKKWDIRSFCSPIKKEAETGTGFDRVLCQNPFLFVAEGRGRYAGSYPTSPLEI